MGATRPASGKYSAIIWYSSYFPSLYPDAGRVAPISACVWCLRVLQRVSSNLKHPKNGLIFYANFGRPAHRIFTTQQ